VGELPTYGARELSAVGEVITSAEDLEVSGDRGERAVRGASLMVRSGEILGIAGVDGNGQVELAEALAGVRTYKSGLLTGPSEVVYIPQDRQSDGLALDMSITENLLVQGHKRRELKTGPFFNLGRIREWVRAIIAEFEIKVNDPADLAGSLSGGNQQKVVVGRSLQATPKLLVALNPTRGLDIRSTQFVHDVLLGIRAKGAAVIIFSTDLDELSAVADRILVMSGGRLEPLGDAAAFVGGSE
jgi:simple sugar transport system ATP-binding protein